MSVVRTPKLWLLFVVALFGLVSAGGAPVSVHDWSLQGLGGRYGITETGYTLSHRMTKDGWKMASETQLWFGPFGRWHVPVSAPIAALGLASGMIAAFGLCYYGFSKLSLEKATA